MTDSEQPDYTDKKPTADKKSLEALRMALEKQYQQSMDLEEPGGNAKFYLP